MVQLIVFIICLSFIFVCLLILLVCLFVSNKIIQTLFYKKDTKYRLMGLSKGLTNKKEEVKKFKLRYQQEIENSITWNIKSFDNLNLYGYFIEGNIKDTIVICLPGCRASAKISYGTQSYIFHKLGYRVLAIDSRSTGVSEGEYISFGEYESIDLLSWIKKIKLELGDINIIVSGVSMGGHTTLLDVDKYDSSVKGVIADSAYTSINEEMLYMLNMHTRFRIFNKLIVLFAHLIIKNKVGLDLFKNRTTESIKNTKCPILLITSDYDSVVDPSFSYMNHLVNDKDTTLEIIENSDHLLNPFNDEKKYLNITKNFIEKCLKNSN